MGKIASIVIPTCNRPEFLAICLNSLLAQIENESGIEIVVTDDSSNEKTRVMLQEKFPDVRWCQGPRLGPGNNRNNGAKSADGEWLIFLDDDCVPRRTLVSAYMNAIKGCTHKNVVLEGPTFREETPKSLLWEAPHNPSGGARISCNFAISRETFFQCGGFDERYTVSAFEDIEFFSRAERLDVETRFVAEAGVDHPLRRIANAQKLAARWESKIIYALDQGASAVELVWRFPEHVAKVIIVRFRKCALNWENLRAVVLFTFEFLWMLWWLPKWLIKRKAEARSAFWAGQVRSGRAVPRYGL